MVLLIILGNFDFFFETLTVVRYTNMMNRHFPAAAQKSCRHVPSMCPASTTGQVYDFTYK